MKYVRLLVFVLAVCALGQTQNALSASDKPAAPPCNNLPAGMASAQHPTQLNEVKRIFVESFGDDIVSKEMQSMLVSSLVSSKRFTVTEDRGRADAVLKGVALEKTSHELHAYGEGTAVGSAAGSHHGDLSGSVVDGNGSISGSSGGGFSASSAAINDSSVNTETVDRARVSVRLVNSDGDVIWTTTQESKGAKYKGASADVADLCVKQLVRDIERIAPEKSSSVQSSSSAAPGAELQAK